jgi:hypothetical protein
MIDPLSPSTTKNGRDLSAFRCHHVTERRETLCISIFKSA